MIYNGSHPQRRKQFSVDRGHNLKSSVQFLWLNSLNYPEPIHDKLLKQKKHQGISQEKYKNYMQSRNLEQYKPTNFRTIEESTEGQSRNSRISGNRSQLVRGSSFDSNDATLNHQLQAFNSRTIEQQNRSRVISNSYHFDASLLKQLNLRSALDKPSITPTDSPRSIQQPFKNIIPDKLENHLRLNIKNSRRRY